MKFTIISDTIPKFCEECIFYIEVFEPTDHKNKVNLVNKCLLGGINHDKCPLTEVKTIWEL